MVISAKTFDEIDTSREKQNIKRLEATLFVAGKYLKMQELMTLLDLNPVIIKDLIEKLKDKYEKMNSAIEIIEKDGVFKMDVKYEHSKIAASLATGAEEFTKAEQETLAIIAFKQPIKQSVVIKIRGNKSYDHIKRFKELRLIHKKKDGHTHILTLTDEFYDYFNVEQTQDTQTPQTYQEEDENETKTNDETTNKQSTPKKETKETKPQIDRGEEINEPDFSDDSKDNTNNDYYSESTQDLKEE